MGMASWLGMLREVVRNAGWIGERVIDGGERINVSIGVIGSYERGIGRDGCGFSLRRNLFSLTVCARRSSKSRGQAETTNLLNVLGIENSFQTSLLLLLRYNLLMNTVRSPGFWSLWSRSVKSGRVGQITSVGALTRAIDISLINNEKKKDH